MKETIIEQIEKWLETLGTPSAKYFIRINGKYDIENSLRNEDIFGNGFFSLKLTDTKYNFRLGAYNLMESENTEELRHKIACRFADIIEQRP